MNNNTNKEIWKAVKEKGYEDYYEVSNLGRVRSVDRVIKSVRGDLHYVGRILSPAPNSDGYLTVNLCDAGKKRNVKVHRLVADAFVTNERKLTEVNHIDEIKHNNNAENLEWCTRKENMNHGTVIKRVKNHPNQIKRREESRKGIIGINVKDKSEIKFNSINEADESGYPRRNIWSSLNGKDATCKGYVWLYEDEYSEVEVTKKLKRARGNLVAHIDEAGNVIEVLGTVKQASEKIGVDNSNVSRACNHGRKTKGYRLKYI